MPDCECPACLNHEALRKNCNLVLDCQVPSGEGAGDGLHLTPTGVENCRQYLQQELEKVGFKGPEDKDNGSWW
jgi:hypothetical protein